MVTVATTIKYLVIFDLVIFLVIYGKVKKIDHEILFFNTT